MKKIMTIFLSFFILVVTVSNSFAQSMASLKDIKYVKSGSQDIISLYTSNYKGFNVFVLPNPDRLVVDIPNNYVSIKGSSTINININSSMIKSIRFSQFTKSSARIVFDLNGQQSYTIEQKSNTLSFIFGTASTPAVKATEANRGDADRPQVENPAYKNIIYSVQEEIATLILKGARLEEIISAESSEGAVDNTAAEAAAYKPLYSEVTDTSGKNFSISFPAPLADLGSGILQINDDILNSIEISNGREGQNTLISFSSSYSRIYDVTYNPQSNDTEIHILKPFTKTDKLVVIDPGHGGSDPGASYEGIREKDLNLKIALKVDEILKSKGIKTFLTRNDDTSVSLYDRANIANDLNASLFLSIHNNAFSSYEYGTETLCYPGDKSRQFASIVQNTLVNALGTRNKGIINRPNLVVLHATKMPAAIAEIAYITNTGDREKLLDDSFLDKAAAALADSIVQALNTM
ncbi:MAG: hypothetical protein A2Y21_09155 [Clostridiales bacterium GWC2_40_7]|nr:MAG: hypothetical protein A2Y21_09155 [Clostridiales bacterium GWC2_40_7]